MNQRTGVPARSQPASTRRWWMDLTLLTLGFALDLITIALALWAFIEGEYVAAAVLFIGDRIRDAIGDLNA